MSCTSVREALNDYVDGELAPEAAQSIRQHLLGCDDCRAEADALRRLVSAARDLPPEQPPSRATWPRIARGIAPVRPWLALPVVALPLLAAAAAWLFLTPPATPDWVHPLRSAASEARAEADLDDLDPATRAVIEENLVIIDAAIADIERALADRPDDPQLVHRLTVAYQQELDLLRQARSISKG